MDGLLRSAADAAGKNQAKQAVASLDQVLQEATLVRYSRNRTLADATKTWYKSWLPRVSPRRTAGAFCMNSTMSRITCRTAPWI